MAKATVMYSSCFFLKAVLPIGKLLIENVLIVLAIWWLFLFFKNLQLNKKRCMMNKKKIATFILVTFGISWLIWLPNGLSHNFDVG
jgi:hypothetical protein